MLCLYYQARVNRTKIWFIVGCFRDAGNIAFERALEGHHDVLEFFVPHEHETEFSNFMNCLMSHGYVVSYEMMENRFVPIPSRPVSDLTGA